MTCLSRRSLFSSAAVMLLGAASLVSCASPGASPTPAADPLAQVEQFVQSFVNGFTTLNSELTALGFPASIVSAIQGFNTTIVTDLKTIQTLATTLQSQPFVKDVVSVVNEVIAVASVLPLPAPLHQILVAAQTVIPFLESLAGLSSTPSKALVSGSSNTHMTLSHALHVLNSPVVLR